MKLPRLAAALGVLVFLAGVAWLAAGQKVSRRARTELLPYQGWVDALSAEDQQRDAQIRAALREAERGRAANKTWPNRFLTEPGVEWLERSHGLYVNYLGIPAAPTRSRWLVLIIEPEPAALKDKPAPEDDEHHTLADGTALHVTVWSAPNQGAVPQVVLPFPAAEGWTQRLR